MAAYRRFVAYVYEYRKDKKGVNCGFVRIEARGNVCRAELHLLCPGLVSGSKCSVYGFVRRDDGTDGILLGMCETEKEQINCILETPTEHMGGSKYSLEKMGGMIITTDQGGFFGTEWDDIPIRPENFRIIETTQENMQKKTQENVRENAQAEGSQATDKGKYDDVKKINREEETKADKAETDNEETDKRETDKTAEEDKTSEKTEAEENAEKSDAGMPEDQELHTQSVSEQDVRDIPSHDIFGDGELHDCHKISPQELCRMGRRTCLLRNNRFVQYGYYHFGHLLLCRNHCGQPVLGVPGRYDQQERFMANMFGFPYFKESSEIQVPGGKGGYWYRLIDSTNSNNGNGC